MYGQTERLRKTVAAWLPVHYSVTATDAGNCQDMLSVDISEPTALAPVCDATDVTSTGGTDGTASVSVSGGTPSYTYLWSTGATTASLSGLTAGTYNVTVTDANGCTSNCGSYSWRANFAISL
ncbi:MAG: SprB repeat-containing protein [Saprospiraceae bacterium]|nr:SprB repeat-containing protein [Saprospiraceae bacterium]